MKINEHTFGDAPAAKYLVKVLNELNNSNVTRAVSRKIVSTNNHVSNLVASYYTGFLSPKTLANTLRLMRSEITNSVDAHSMFVDRLCVNVQIGTIKQALRLASVARKSETMIKNSKTKTTTQVVGYEHWYYDHELDRYIKAGRTVGGVVVKNIFTLDEVSVVTPEILNARSQARCTRLKKSHTVH